MLCWCVSLNNTTHHSSPSAKIWNLVYRLGNTDHIAHNTANPQTHASAMEGAAKIAANGWHVWVEHHTTGERVYDSSPGGSTEPADPVMETALALVAQKHLGVEFGPARLGDHPASRSCTIRGIKAALTAAYRAGQAASGLADAAH